MLLNRSQIFNVHQYLDSDYSGTNPECTYNNVDAFSYLAKWLRTNNRQAFITETGGGNTASCATLLCQELDGIKYELPTPSQYVKLLTRG